jgi:uncharacterized Zn-binding protein involved in type VI secretion
MTQAQNDAKKLSASGASAFINGLPAAASGFAANHSATVKRNPTTFF